MTLKLQLLNQLRLLEIGLLKRLKGDFVGHPFRGNQWLGGIGQSFRGSLGDAAAAIVEWNKEHGPKGFDPIKIGNSTLAGARWGEKGFEKWRDGLSKNEVRAIVGYKDGSYQQINNSLRHDNLNGLSPTHQAYVRDLDAALSRAECPDDVVVFRGGKLPSGLQTGSQFTDKGFLSTSTSLSVASGFSSYTLMEIQVPKGTHCAWIDNWHADAGVPTEAELLLPRNTTFEVIGTRVDNDMGYNITTLKIVQ